jgi:serine/threonine-protein kinase
MLQRVQLGKYELVSLLASGGMGEVFLARATGPGGFSKLLVVKRILAHLARDQRFVDMFLNEAKLAALISHPNVVQIFELGVQNGTYFLAMEHIAGGSLRALRQRLKERAAKLPAPLAAYIAIQMLRGLHAAHTLTDEKGKALQIVHRDVSPDNALVSYSGEVKLIDFGVAKATNASSATRTGQLKGKCAYMAPEQLHGLPLDARTDVYAVGVVLFELLTGYRPFEAPTDAAMITAILFGSRRPFPADVPVALQAIVERALQREPRARYPTAAEMADALVQYLADTDAAVDASTLAAFMVEQFGAEASRSSPGALATPLGQGTASVGGSAAAASSPSAISTTVSTGAAASRSRLALAGIVAVLTVAVGLGIALRPQRAPLSPRRGESRGVGQAVATSSAPVASPPLAVSTPAPEPVEPDAHPAPSAEPSAPPKRKAKRPKPAPTPVVAAAEPPARVGTGTVEVRIRPWAEVYLGDRRLGTTPMDPVEAPAGEQTFTLKNADLGVERRVSVRVPAGGTVLLKADLLHP